MYIYSVHNFHLLFFTSLISLLHFMMAALQSSNNSNISVISVLVSINYPQGLPYSWFDDWFSTETWMFWGMTLGDSGSYFNLWLELVSSDGGLAVSGSKRSLSFYQTLLPELTLGSVTRRQGTGEVHSCSWQAIRCRSGFWQGGCPLCSETPSDLGYLEDCGHDQGEFRPSPSECPLPTPKLTSSKGQPALQDSKPTGYISILFLNCILFFSLFLFIW